MNLTLVLSSKHSVKSSYQNSMKLNKGKWNGTNWNVKKTIWLITTFHFSESSFVRYNYFTNIRYDVTHNYCQQFQYASFQLYSKPNYYANTAYLFVPIVYEFQLSCKTWKEHKHIAKFFHEINTKIRMFFPSWIEKYVWKNRFHEVKIRK